MIKVEIDAKKPLEIMKNLKKELTSGFQGAKAGFLVGDKGKQNDEDSA